MKRVAAGCFVIAAIVAVLCAGRLGAQEAASQPATAAPSPAGSVEFTILHINDAHGHLESYRNAKGDIVGGYARLSTLVNEVRASSKGQRVFLVHCGDEFSRGDTLTQRSHGRINVAVMNLLKFDFWVPGNGDYYDWKDRAGTTGGVDNLQARIAQAQFKVLAANVTLRATGKPLAQEYAIEQVGPAKVAFFGLCTVYDDDPAGRPVEAASALDTARRLVPELHKQADIVVALTHVGVPEDLSLAATVPGIDLIIGAHTHNALRQGLPVPTTAGNTVLVCQAGQYMEYLGRVDLTLEPADGRYKLAKAKAQLIPLDQKVKFDPAVTALIAKLSRAGAAPSAQPSAPPAKMAR